MLFQDFFCFLKWYKLMLSCSHAKENQTSFWMFQDIILVRENENVELKRKDEGVWFEQD